jgi:hypothetical protein
MAAMSSNDTEITNIKAQIVELAPVGSALPLAPELQWNVRARRDSEFMGNAAYTQIADKNAGESFSSLEADKRYQQDAYRIVDLAYGFVFELHSSQSHMQDQQFCKHLVDNVCQLLEN